MDIACIGRLTGDKLKDPATYWLAGVVGTLINVYGHLLVPWLHGDAVPVSTFLAELTGSYRRILVTVGVRRRLEAVA
jgi:hypothetical protein